MGGPPIKREFIAVDNINTLFPKYDIPADQLARRVVAGQEKGL
jgi:hypothetical protein